MHDLPPPPPPPPPSPEERPASTSLSGAPADWAPPAVPAPGATPASDPLPAPPPTPPAAHDKHSCARCGRPLGLFHHGLCKECQQAVEAAQAAARQGYAAELADIADPSQPLPDLAAVRGLAAQTGWPPEHLTQESAGAVGRRIDAALADDFLSQRERHELEAVVEGLGLGWGDVLEGDRQDRLLIGMINAGCPPSVDDPRLLVQPGEAVWLEPEATLLKRVDVRQFQGGSSGFSVPLGHTGIRYRVGGFRGQSVVVGAKQVTDDTGVLSVSSRRVVFLGGRRTLEVPYPKLAGVTVFADGIRFNVTGRQIAPLFLLSHVHVVAALVQFAMRPAEPGAADHP